MSSDNERQRIERVPGARRAKLTAVQGTIAEPIPADDEPEVAPAVRGTASGPNDERLRQDVPPHY